MFTPRSPYLFTVAIGLCCNSAMTNDARAEAWSDTPPRFLQIQREEVKVGMLSKHSKNEARYVAMMEGSKIPNYYTALSSDSAMEEWFLIPFTSHAQHGELLKLQAKDPQFTKTEERILEKALFAKWGEAVISTETHRLSVDPVQSYVPKEVRAQDPAFWLKK